jgi:hypothetical protein
MRTYCFVNVPDGGVVFPSHGRHQVQVPCHRGVLSMRSLSPPSNVPVDSTHSKEHTPTPYTHSGCDNTCSELIRTVAAIIRNLDACKTVFIRHRAVCLHPDAVTDILTHTAAANEVIGTAGR